MKTKESSIEKVCSFYVNEWHLTTMMLPYINKRVSQNTKVITMLQISMREKVEELISKMNLSDESTKNILNINWTSNRKIKYVEIKKSVEETLDADTIDILVNGTADYIDIVNKNIEKVVQENENKIKQKKITIINCYEVTQFSNINAILQKHHMILNTSGLRRITEVFEGYAEEA